MEATIQNKIRSKLIEHRWRVSKPVWSTKGWPDLQADKQGRTVYIEVKAEGKKAAPLQLLRHRQLRKRGFEVIVADSLINIQHLLT